MKMGWPPHALFYHITAVIYQCQGRVNRGKPPLTVIYMNRCQGSIPVSTKVDQPMRTFIEDEAERLAITPSEFMRRLLLFYRESCAENTPCDHCGQPVVVELTF